MQCFWYGFKAGDCVILIIQLTLTNKLSLHIIMHRIHCCYNTIGCAKTKEPRTEIKHKTTAKKDEKEYSVAACCRLLFVDV